MKMQCGIKFMSSDGLFSLGVQSIEWQLQNLFSECGGEDAVELLNKLSDLTVAERQILLSHFTKAVSKVAAGEIRLNDPIDPAANDFEDALYQDIVKSLEESKSREKFAVVQGGKGISKNGLIDFASEKRRRNISSVPPTRLQS